ncbi:uncharacterized protein LOC128327952 [Hemicordylus capensis]|uniref:uncharacterized protein LOC128327952 n=1 Tax=Hemicordylus capensis TaxID=884348 RepID=UPI0023027E8F|nr:uncharacterized protein LOC128327952 [Hemicordylus capensis]XP_053113358.1 uncharacterized protein LOC128327952 [Hemicordylus capensis]XP_053113365.1 uncharacterized protein LOC128327952 [Hemicordylus capensis]XP_053113375.1 uncharacterized protein LOC128327952 [Hemicordylus capensis]XP_053113385.1 uncharacterized protein LOC128327952 [Hemicordylus capensis]XP_053113396.1 uncharacterized protein LOC128327952 [Hemicordylus capensis]XP_053113405.1 uncharacterized protein LOC128327952 [Hemico
MVGCNNSVWSRLKEASPSCLQLRCICHSLALCIQRAASKLPSNIGFLLSEIPGWFCHSDLRREAYKQLFRATNTATEFKPARTAPLPFEKPSLMQWLVRAKLMFNILMNWEELRAYFTTVELAQSMLDIQFKARLLKEMLWDYKNYLFFEFATPVVQEFERLNSLFQKTKAHELCKQLFLHHESLQNRLYDARGQKKNIHEVDFGVKFLTVCNKFLQQKNNCAEAHLEIDNVKGSCLCMLEEALRDTFGNLSKLSPVIVLNQASRPRFSELPFVQLHAGNDVSTIEEQYRKLPRVAWNEEAQFEKDGLPTDTEQFWLGVL